MAGIVRRQTQPRVRSPSAIRQLSELGADDPAHPERLGPHSDRAPARRSKACCAPAGAHFGEKRRAPVDMRRNLVRATARERSQSASDSARRPIRAANSLRVLSAGAKWGCPREDAVQLRQPHRLAGSAGSRRPRRGAMRLHEVSSQRMCARKRRAASGGGSSQAVRSPLLLVGLCEFRGSAPSCLNPWDDADALPRLGSHDGA